MSSPDCRLQIAFFAVLTCGRCASDGYVTDKSTGISYRLVYNAQPWPIARQKCEDEGSKLAVPKTPEQFSFLQKLVRAMQYPRIKNSSLEILVWLGINNLQNYTVWKNIDGENIADTGFHTWAGLNGQGYSDAPEEPHCVGLDAVNPGLRDFWCHQYQPYFCQKILT
ncbi:uncharacterized protein LOC116770798 isoform X1 [Danaus plexippus]|uniref:uncharacterized protein LOC116770798 isoform X1 n=1 Tax=Danaus plexippus TaxID=13037 RepID=UPI002AB26B3E|nr:uncharacterized protein LOC116770798 isoform X1 [Danaus plexippus]